MKKVLLFLVAFCTLFGALKAQEDATISPNNIKYWVGEGENEAILIVQWCDPEIAFAWGYRFDGDEVIVGDMMNAIAEEDSRFSYDGQGNNFVNNIMYVDDEYDLALTDYSSYFMYNINGSLAGLGFEEQTIVNGDVVKFGVSSCAIIGSDWSYTWTTPVTPVSDPNASEEVVDATIDPEDIEFWVGEGENEVVVIISWCENTETALAWGYRFNGTTNLFAALTDIAAADDRLTVEGSAPSNITYLDEDYDLTMEGDYPMHGINGALGQTGMSGQAIVDGDVAKIGGYDCCIIEGGWTDGTISWTTEVLPATDPNAGEEEITVSAEDIRFWTGEGDNEVVAAFFFCADEPIGIAYGYRFENEATISDMMESIAAADEHFTYSVSGGWINGVSYNDGEHNLAITDGMLMYTVNGNYASGLSDALADGDYFEMTEWGDCELPTDNIFYPVDPSTPEEFVDATIDADELLYWIGEGCHEATMIVDWCNDGVALAWGYRFNTDSVTVATMLQTIADADENFGFSGLFSWLTNLYYLNGNDTAYQISPDYVVYNHNGNYANTADLEYIFPGDYVKFGAWGCAHNDDETWASTWNNTITPAPAPEEVGPSDEVFDGPVGSDDCQGIHCQDPAILGWASTCTVERGRQNITTPGVFASYGTDNDAVGEVTESTTSGVVSLGDYGMAVLTFDIPIQNGDGYDFAVFENALNNTFLELAFVEVSSDGVNYFRFPSISNTPTDVQIDNNGGVNATHLNNLAGKHLVGWGTPFDLEELAGTEGLDINNITHIRLVDVVGCVEPRYATRDSRGHIINDPYPTPFASSGFDLAGVGVMNGWRPATSVAEYTDSHLLVYPNPCNDQVTVETVIGEPVMLFNSVGTLVYRTNANDTTTTLNMSDRPTGLYIVKCGNRAARIVKM